MPLSTNTSHLLGILKHCVFGTVSFSIRLQIFSSFFASGDIPSILNRRAVDPDSAFQVNQDPIRIQGFDDQKLKKKHTKNSNLLMFKLQEKTSALKEKIQHFKKM